VASVDCEGLRPAERYLGNDRPYGGAAGGGIVPTPFLGYPADEVDAAAARLVMTGVVVDDRTCPTLIVNFEPDPAAHPGEVSEDVTRAVNHGVGDHLVEGQFGVQTG
jgi:hypothetical protein